MPDVKISALPTKTVAADDMVPVVNAGATTTSRVTAGAIAGLVVDASQLTSGTLPDARLSANVVVTSDPRLSDARTPTAHTHGISEVTGLQAALDGKQASGSYSTVGHTHGLTDLAQSSASANQVVTWNGTNWVPATVSYNNITDKPASSGISVATIWALS